MNLVPVYRIHLSKRIQKNILKMPEQVRKKISKDVYPRLKSAPIPANPPIKKLRLWKTKWRYRIGFHRLVYDVSIEERLVTLQDIGHRKNIYNRLGHHDIHGPTNRVLKEAPFLVEDAALVPVRNDSKTDSTWVASKPSGEKDTLLPVPITDELMEEASIAEEHKSHIRGISTEGELLALPEEYVEPLLELIYPPRILDIFNCPTRVVESAMDLDEFLEGERDFESFLLALDKSQQPIVNRFKERQPIGPWVIKGGPGTGKSTLALYCMRELLSPKQRELFNETVPVKILFTTYTHSLIALSKHIFNAICDDPPSHQPEITNIDQYAKTILTDRWKNRRVINDKELKGLISKLIKEKPAEFKFSAENDSEFLAEEIAQVIFGNSLPDLQDYLSVKRTGRTRSLGQEQRKNVWNVYSAIRSELEKSNKRTFSQTIAVAEWQARQRKAEFDYVFIDEAQDLSPSAIRLCVNLCKNRKNVFLTADLNQSIYGSSVSWASIDTDLNMKGRSQTLRRNFRTSVEICEAIQGLQSGEVDKESRLHHENAVYHSERPVFSMPTHRQDELSRIEKFLQQALLEEKIAKSSAVVLCQSKSECIKMAAALDKRFNAKAMPSKEVEFAYAGVKVMTVHAAKGLEFGVTVVAGVGREWLSPAPKGKTVPWDEKYAQKHRLFFVACSRAIRRLMVSGKLGEWGTPPSEIDPKYWEIWNS